MTKIKYEDLSGWLKFAIIISWICGGIVVLSFLLGFIEGILGIY